MSASWSGQGPSGRLIDAKRIMTEVLDLVGRDLASDKRTYKRIPFAAPITVFLTPPLRAWSPNRSWQRSCTMFRKLGLLSSRGKT